MRPPLGPAIRPRRRRSSGARAEQPGSSAGPPGPVNAGTIRRPEAGRITPRLRTCVEGSNRPTDQRSKSSATARSPGLIGLPPPLPRTIWAIGLQGQRRDQKAPRPSYSRCGNARVDKFARGERPQAGLRVIYSVARSIAGRARNGHQGGAELVVGGRGDCHSVSCVPACDGRSAIGAKDLDIDPD